MTQVSSAVDVLWNLYEECPEKLSKVDWEYLIRNHTTPYIREILIKNMHEHIKPIQDKYEQQWRTANKDTLQRIGQCVANGGARNLLPLAYERPASKTQTKRAKTGKNREKQGIFAKNGILGHFLHNSD